MGKKKQYLHISHIHTCIHPENYSVVHFLNLCQGKSKQQQLIEPLKGAVDLPHFIQTLSPSPILMSVSLKELLAAASCAAVMAW